LLVISGLTMITGVLGAVAQVEIRRILSFHIVSQIGYMIMGLALFTPLALAGSIFYIIHHIVVKTNLFLIGGMVERYGGSGRLSALGGFCRKYPLLALLFLVTALSLAGIPPLSGFFAKFVLIRAGLESEQYLIVIAALGVGMLTLFSMTKIWSEAFWKPQPEDNEAAHTETSSIFSRARFSAIAPMVLLAAISVGIGLAAGPIMSLSANAAGQLMNPGEYIRAVLEP
ncbi:MAG: proton-conducting transporter membrane subunit, partial [Acidobacteriota bacterium]